MARIQGSAFDTIGIRDPLIRARTKRARRDALPLLGECLAATPSWPDALDRFEGKGQVPLMTIHM